MPRIRFRVILAPSGRYDAATVPSGFGECRGYF